MATIQKDFAGKKILAVDDETDVTDLLDYKLQQEGFLVQSVNDPLRVMTIAKEFQPDLILLDIMMPELNGFQICRMIRSDPAFKNVAIIFLTARGDTSDRVQGLEYGADDYLAKPFDIKELVLRARAIFNRMSSGQSPQPRHLEVPPITMDCEKHLAFHQGVPILLTATEFRLLRLLLENKDKVLSRDELLAKVWNYEGMMETRTVDTHIRRLRDKLKENGGMIQTVRGVGYKLTES